MSSLEKLEKALTEKGVVMQIHVNAKTYAEIFETANKLVKPLEISGQIKSYKGIPIQFESLVPDGVIWTKCSVRVDE